MTSEIATCRIWGQDYAAVGQSIPDPSKIIVTESDRAGGGYVILGGVGRHIAGLEDGEKARLTTWLVDQRLQGDIRPVVTDEIVEYAVSRHPLPIYERAGRLLRFLSKQTKVAGEFISLFQHSGEFTRDSVGIPISPDMPTNPTFLAAAWSESISSDEISYLVDYLEENGWVHESFKGSDVILRSHEYRVTVSGYVRIAEESANADASQAFVAMWFDDSVERAYDEGIAPAIRDCGFEPKRIDRDPTVDKINDAIIAEIRRSRFLVADFTHGNEGARGGVYYEAGFAHGLEIPVIFTCRADIIDEIHFDTRQYSHIAWDSTSELRNSLRDRILARIGEGPNIRHAATMAEAIASDFYDGRLDLSARDVAPGSTWSRMPEVECVSRLRVSGASHRTVRLFLTFIAAMDRNRDATLLWNNGVKLFQSYPELFEPAEASAVPVSRLRERLSRYGVSRVVDCGIGNAGELLRYLRTSAEGQFRFPLLRGPKIGPMWVRMLVAPGGAKIDDIAIIPLQPA